MGVTDFLTNEQHVERGSTLFVATGVPAEELRALTAAFDVRHGPSYVNLPSGMRHEFMDYASAMVQKMVCVDATRFFGHRQSSFSDDIYQQRQYLGNAFPGV